MPSWTTPRRVAPRALLWLEQWRVPCTFLLPTVHGGEGGEDQKLGIPARPWRIRLLNRRIHGGEGEEDQKLEMPAQPWRIRLLNQRIHEGEGGEDQKLGIPTRPWRIRLLYRRIRMLDQRIRQGRWGAGLFSTGSAELGLALLVSMQPLEASTCR